VVAVEYNGFQASFGPVLSRASARDRAASMFWNVNAVTRLSFAEGGRVLATFEPPSDVDAGPEVAAALAGLDFADYRHSKIGKGLVAVQRFTGRGITAEDLARIEAADVAFRIVPELPALHPYRPQPAGLRGRVEPTGPLGADTAALAQVPPARLRDLAWWAAAEAARYAGLAEDPDIAASVAARELTPAAVWRARRSQLHDGEHRSMWLALHRATNPDPVAAAVETLDAARYAAGPHAAELVAEARRRITAE
jgi:hypothetical protein